MLDREFKRELDATAGEDDPHISMRTIRRKVLKKHAPNLKILSIRQEGYFHTTEDIERDF